MKETKEIKFSGVLLQRVGNLEEKVRAIEVWGQRENFDIEKVFVLISEVKKTSEVTEAELQKLNASFEDLSNDALKRSEFKKWGLLATAGVTIFLSWFGSYLFEGFKTSVVKDLRTIVADENFFKKEKVMGK